MTVKTYERIGILIRNIKRSKTVIDRNKRMIDRDFGELNQLLRENNQPEIKLEDLINHSCEYDDEDFVF